jgi:WXG100 family type VII secretion target
MTSTSIPPPVGGAGSGFKVTPQDVAAASTYIEGQAADIDGKIAALGSYVAGLATYWQGPAQQAFDTLMADYRTYALMLHNALTDIASGLRGNYVNYSETERSNLSNIVRVHLPAAKF